MVHRSSGIACLVVCLFETKSLDLGTYSQGAAKTVTFDKPGTVEVEK